MYRQRNSDIKATGYCYCIPHNSSYIAHRIKIWDGDSFPPTGDRYPVFLPLCLYRFRATPPNVSRNCPVGNLVPLSDLLNYVRKQRYLFLRQPSRAVCLIWYTISFLYNSFFQLDDKSHTTNLNILLSTWYMFID